MAFTDEDLKRLKDNLSSYGVDPGIDVCNYFDDAAEVADLIARLEAAEKVIDAYEKDAYMDKFERLRKAWRKAAGK